MASLRAVAHVYIFNKIDNAYSEYIYRKNPISSNICMYVHIVYISKKVKRGKKNTINFHLQTIKHDRNEQHTQTQ